MDQVVGFVARISFNDAVKARERKREKERRLLYLINHEKSKEWRDSYNEKLYNEISDGILYKSESSTSEFYTTYVKINDRSSKDEYFEPIFS